MTSLAEALSQVENQLGVAVSKLIDESGAHGLSDDDTLAAMAAASRITRLGEALLVEMVAQAEMRSERAAVDDRLTVRHGCRNVRELVQRVTLQSSRSVTETVRAARGVARWVAPSTGEVLPARYPALRAACAAGALGIDGLSAVFAALDAAACSETARLAADEELAASALGLGADGGPAPCIDDLRNQATVWAMYLDQDGAEPREIRAMRKRGITLGVCRDGIVPVRGGLLPEVAGQFQLLLDSVLNPRVDGPTGPEGPFFREADDDGPFTERTDERTPAQRRHDALAMILSAAARAGEVPTIGGAAPTLVVQVTADELASGRGYAHIDGIDEPVSLAVARQVACGGAIQRVTCADGRILAIGITDRVFAAHQRRAIGLRDGGCIIPGCHVPAAWCEIHHVEEASCGGPTHTDNGVLLCWWHHRTIDTGGWRVRMNRGVPEVRGPAWWDSSGQWRPITKSVLRMRQRFRA